jgi:hypothetical protein
MAALLGISIATAAYAQAPTDSTTQSTPTPAEPSPAATPAPAATNSLIKGGVMAELLSVNVPRSEPEIQKLIDESRALARYAEEESRSNKELATTADGRAKIMNSEIEVTKAKRDAAKKTKDKVAIAELDAAFKKQTSEYKYLVQVRDALKADADRLQSAQAAAKAQERALDQELKVVRKLAALGENPPSQAVSEYRTMLRAMLESQREAADRGREANDKRRKVVEERLKQLDALSKMSP